MLIFVTTPLRFVASVVTLVWIGACVGYIVRDVQAQDAKP